MTTSEALSEPGVVAVVLTYDAPADELAACLAAVQGQTVLPDEVLVVDNHGSVPLDVDTLGVSGDAPVRVLRLAENTGVAGGYAAGMQHLLDSDAGYCWAMDDDVRPDASCLAELLAALRARDGRAVAMPRAIDLTSGAVDDNGYGWWGVLVPRAAVERCGVPNVQFFYGVEEQEYFIDRLPLAGFPIARTPSAVVRSHQRASTSIAAWKYYYLARNLTYQYLYGRRHLPLGMRLKSLVHALVRWSRTVVTARTERRRKVAYLVRGVSDGVLGRLGKRVMPDRADRSWDVVTNTPS